jgi:hypothetical protein
MARIARIFVLNPPEPFSTDASAMGIAEALGHRHFLMPMHQEKFSLEI